MRDDRWFYEPRRCNFSAADCSCPCHPSTDDEAVAVIDDREYDDDGPKKGES